MAAAFPHLLEPGLIGPMATRNRLLLSPMGDRLAHDDGTVSERQATYLEARARGGVGVVMVGSVAVSYPAGAYATCQTAMSDDRFVPGLRALADRVHGHGARIGAQLVHDGANSLLDIAEGRPMLVPSIPPRLRPDRPFGHGHQRRARGHDPPVHHPHLRAPPTRWPTRTTSSAVIDAFVAAAVRARDAGFDGGRDPRRPRLPDRLVPLARPQPARRRLGW